MKVASWYFRVWKVWNTSARSRRSLYSLYLMSYSKSQGAEWFDTHYTVHTLLPAKTNSSSANHTAAMWRATDCFFVFFILSQEEGAEIELNTNTWISVFFSLIANSWICFHVKEQVHLSGGCGSAQCLVQLHPDITAGCCWTLRPRPPCKLLWQLQHLAVREPTAASH